MSRLHLYLYDKDGHSDSRAVAEALEEYGREDVKTIAINHPQILRMIAADGRVNLIPCVVSIDERTMDIVEVYEGEYLVSHFLDPLKQVMGTHRARREQQEEEPPEKLASAQESARELTRSMAAREAAEREKENTIH